MIGDLQVQLSFGLIWFFPFSATANPCPDNATFSVLIGWCG